MPTHRFMTRLPWAQSLVKSYLAESAHARYIVTRPYHATSLQSLDYSNITREPPDGDVPHIECADFVIDNEHKGTQVSICNTSRGNCMSVSLLASLTKVFQRLATRTAADDDNIRCVTLRGSRPRDPRKSPAFCTGMDIREMAALETPEQATRLISHVRDACAAIRDLPVITIASIQGPVFGAGLEIAASCDFRCATPDSTFAMPEVKLGIPSVVQARLLANIIGWQRTKRLVYLAETVDAATAEQWGLVDFLAHSTEHDAAMEAFIASTVAANGPEAMKAQKRLVRLWEETDLVTGVDAGVESFASMFEIGAREPNEYMGQFLRRRKESKDQKGGGT